MKEGSLSIKTMPRVPNSHRFMDRYFHSFIKRQVAPASIIASISCLDNSKSVRPILTNVVLHNILRRSCRINGDTFAVDMNFYLLSKYLILHQNDELSQNFERLPVVS